MVVYTKQSHAQEIQISVRRVTGALITHLGKDPIRDYDNNEFIPPLDGEREARWTAAT